MRSLWIAAQQTTKNSLLGLLLLAACSVAAQPRTVTGKVSSDKADELMQGVTVRVKNSGRATKTNAEGGFSIVAEPNAVLVFTMVGFEAKEVQITNQTNVNVVLTSSTKVMEDIVVIG